MLATALRSVKLTDPFRLTVRGVCPKKSLNRKCDFGNKLVCLNVPWRGFSNALAMVRFEGGIGRARPRGLHRSFCRAPGMRAGSGEGAGVPQLSRPGLTPGRSEERRVGK